eukprot:gnl/TRDRNA2_/TRDRNA2_118347_c0_seq1.p1 gnl/TRDRNA2_/TRDRNA2_118347_c0~~gnl/TRDRNA2_/TRDRNA2_118347_c0_seq1.p1  ORF type:complete len:389 (-),score=45.12 gnl/TRDRNA2_/TRDRNA2_118347_c0_seq1:314-1480(-)
MPMPTNLTIGRRIGRQMTGGNGTIDGSESGLEIINGNMSNIDMRGTSGSSNSSKHTCKDISETENGTWRMTDDPPSWVPKGCDIHIFSPAEANSCLRTKRIAFFADSVSLRIWNAIVQLLQRADVDQRKKSSHQKTRKLVMANSPIFFTPQGYKKLSWLDSSGSFDFWWAPSVYHQQPLEVLPEDQYRKLNFVIIGWGVWNMGSYYRGVDEFASNLPKAIAELKNKGPTVLLANIHKLHPEMCPKKAAKGPCVECNSGVKEELFHRIIGDVAASAQAHGWGDKLQLFDTRGLTNTLEAHADATDAVHFGTNTSTMEAQVLLNMICRDSEGRRLTGRASSAKGALKYGWLNRILQLATGESLRKPCTEGFKPAHYIALRDEDEVEPLPY